MLGIDPIVKRCLHDLRGGHFFLKRGHETSTADARMCFAIAAVSSLPCEAVHLPLVNDDRFLRHGAQILLGRVLSPPAAPVFQFDSPYEAR